MAHPFRKIEEQALLQRIHSRLAAIERDIAAGNCDGVRASLEFLNRGLEAWTQAAWERKHNELLTQVALALSKAVALDEILAQIVDGLALIVPYDSAGVFIVEGDGSHIAAEYLRGYRRDAYERVHQKVGEGIVGHVVATGRTAIINDVSRDPHYIAARSGTRSELAVPMFNPSSGEVIGAFNLESNNLNAYTGDDADLVATVAAYAAVAIERARMYQHLIHQQRITEELALARRIQQSLLPANQALGGLDIHGYSYPSEQVGGDYYDFFPLTTDDVAVTIADVVGKGVPAALVMAGLRGSLRVEARNTYSIGRIFGHVNSFLLATSQPGEYVTLFYGVINRALQQLTYSNAGHHPALLRRNDGEVISLTVGNVPIGAFPESEWPETVVPFRPGDALMLYTDGITDAESKQSEMFGMKRLTAVFGAVSNPSARAIVEAVKNAVERHLDGNELSDDMTMLAVVFSDEAVSG